MITKNLKSVCTLGIGGIAKHYTLVHTIQDMQKTLKACYEKNTPYFILGKGSNMLFDDRGFSHLVIHNKIQFLHEEDKGLFYLGAGNSFSHLGAKTALLGYSGLEFASGIPGTVGGAVFMNAGANDKETCLSLVGVDFVTNEGELRHYLREELHFSYRTSCFHDIQGAIVAARFQLSPSTSARKTQLEIVKERLNCQPYQEKSAGCMFQNPPSISAGALIDQLGLKGLKIGGAMVSPKHANFIVNTGKATSQDVLALINRIKQQVKLQTGIDLKEEVRFLPYRY